MIGFLAIRHTLNDFLLELGGHIGYSVRPARRGQGHATRALALGAGPRGRARHRPGAGHLRPRQRAVPPDDRAQRRGLRGRAEGQEALLDRHRGPRSLRQVAVEHVHELVRVDHRGVDDERIHRCGGGTAPASPGHRGCPRPRSGCSRRTGRTRSGRRPGSPRADRSAPRGGRRAAGAQSPTGASISTSRTQATPTVTVFASRKARYAATASPHTVARSRTADEPAGLGARGELDVGGYV